MDMTTIHHKDKTKQRCSSWGIRRKLAWRKDDGYHCEGWSTPGNEWQREWHKLIREIPEPCPSPSGVARHPRLLLHFTPSTPETTRWWQVVRDRTTNPLGITTCTPSKTNHSWRATRRPSHLHGLTIANPRKTSHDCKFGKKGVSWVEETRSGPGSMLMATTLHS
jgi:hypothetical protein